MQEFAILLCVFVGVPALVSVLAMALAKLLGVDLDRVVLTDEMRRALREQGEDQPRLKRGTREESD